jgi:guanylate kinase
MSHAPSAAAIDPERLLVGRPLLVVIGPSASGKSSVVRELNRRGVVNVHPTWTTRPCRADETGGSVEHRFVSEAAFDRLCAEGFFVDTVCLFGLSFRYGLPKITVAQSGPIDTVMLRAPMVGRLALLVPECLVYQISDTDDRTARRLAARRSPVEEVAARLGDNRSEVEAGRAVADRVFVNDRLVASLADEIAAALAVDIAANVPLELHDQGGPR